MNFTILPRGSGKMFFLSKYVMYDIYRHFYRLGTLSFKFNFFGMPQQVTIHMTPFNQTVTYTIYCDIDEIVLLFESHTLIEYGKLKVEYYFTLRPPH